MKFVNFKKFEKFIKDNVKSKNYNLEAYRLEVIEHAQSMYYGETGEYELSKYITKSGNPERIRFEYNFDYDEELDQSSNHIITF